MKGFFSNIVWGLLAVACATPFLILAYMLFAWTPVYLYADAECLRHGYPKAEVTIGLERYCTTIDGAVTVKVFKP